MKAEFLWWKLQFNLKCSCLPLNCFMLHHSPSWFDPSNRCSTISSSSMCGAAYRGRPCNCSGLHKSGGLKLQNNQGLISIVVRCFITVWGKANEQYVGVKAKHGKPEHLIFQSEQQHPASCSCLCSVIMSFKWFDCKKPQFLWKSESFRQIARKVF